MKNTHKDFISSIGNTPLIKLRGPSEKTGCNIYGKAEFLNPGEGFWIRANNDGAITLVSSGENNDNSGSSLLKLR